jgi:lysophospholipase L1-like esterase
MTTQEITRETRQNGSKMLATIGFVVFAVVACLFVLDTALRLALPATKVLRHQIDIQTPTALYSKIEELRHFKGAKVVVLGDSLVFGRSMRDHGDTAWQSHTLSSQLETMLNSNNPSRPVMVANLGMNGTLPVDLDQLVRIITPLKPDLIIFDLSLRSFSRDFEREADSQTRPWLAQLTISPSGGFSTTSVQSDWRRGLSDVAVNSWYLYQLKDFFQSLVFDGQPSAYLTQIRNDLDGWFKAKAQTAAQKEDPLDALLLTMRARSRYSRIDMATDNPQVQALKRLLARLESSQQPALAFYATENPQQLGELIDRTWYDKLHVDLASHMSSASKNVAFFGPLSIYEPKNFLDHVHLDKEGYRLLATHLAPAAKGKLDSKRAY